MRHLAVSFFVFFCFLSSASAEKVDLVDVPISDFAGWVSDSTNKNIILGAGVDALVSLHAPNVSPDDYFQLFRDTVSSLGYSLSESRNFVVVTVGSVDQTTSKSTPDADIEKPIPPVLRRFSLHHIEASKILSSVRLAIPSGSVSLLPRNDLLVSAPENELETFETLISALDCPPRRLMVEAIVLETTNSDIKDIGFKLSAKSSSEGLSFVSDVLLPSDAGIVGLLTRNSFQAVLSALESVDNVRLLSTPQILLNDGETGSVIVGQNVPFVTGRISSDSVSASQPLTTIERQDVGTSLSITSTVVSDDRITLQIKQNSSSVTTATFASDIITNTRGIVTSVDVAPGEVISLGGLNSEDFVDNVLRVPLLGHLPYIGRLFTFTHSEKTKKQLNVFLKVTFV